MKHSSPMRRSTSNFSRGLAAVALMLGGGLFGDRVASAQDPGAEIAAPPTRRVPAGETWQLEFKPGPLRVYVDPYSGEAYWYLTYEVSNRSGRERMWAPRIELQTDAGQVQSSGQGVPRLVTQDLQRTLSSARSERRTEKVLDQNQVIGPIVTGPEHAREGLVVWRIEDPTVTEVSVYVGGVTNHRETATHPETGEPVVLRRARALRFVTPGELALLEGTAIEPSTQEWVLR
ncbi:MAG: hypothetical protein ACO3Y3_01870 [Phycisphaerales bacterium]